MTNSKDKYSLLHSEMISALQKNKYLIQKSLLKTNGQWRIKVLLPKKIGGVYYDFIYSDNTSELKIKRIVIGFSKLIGKVDIINQDNIKGYVQEAVSMIE